jgi:predicted nucleic acid-binding protein
MTETVTPGPVLSETGLRGIARLISRFLHFCRKVAYPGRAALAQLAKKNLASYLRDISPKQTDRELRSFSRAARILSFDHPRLIESHPNQWVGIHGGSVCATARSFSALVAQLKKRGLSPNDAIIRYIDTSGRKLIL